MDRSMRVLSLGVAVVTGTMISGPLSAYETVSVENGGVISGVVRLKGEAPEREQLKVTRDKKVCAQSPKFDKSLIVSNGNLVNAVVSIKNIEKGKDAKKEEAVLDQNQCEYVPHVLGVQVGNPVEILNSDGILHNIHSYSEENDPFNKAMPKFKKKLTVKFAKPEAVPVRCDVHSWMSGWIFVTDNPYYSITGENGQFALTEVPPGKYTVEVWHETLGKKQKEVNVKPGEEVTLEFEMSQS